MYAVICTTVSSVLGEVKLARIQLPVCKQGSGVQVNTLWDVKLQDCIKNIHLQPLVNSLHGGLYIVEFILQAPESYLQLFNLVGLTLV